MPSPAAVLSRLCQSFRTRLSTDHAPDDSINTVSQAILRSCRTSPDAVRQYAHLKLYATPFSEVPACWRRLYTEGALWKALELLEVHLEHVNSIGDDRGSFGQRGDDWMLEVVRVVDTAVIMTMAERREALVAWLIEQLEDFLSAACSAPVARLQPTTTAVQGNLDCSRDNHSSLDRSSKRRKVSYGEIPPDRFSFIPIYPPTLHVPATFPTSPRVIPQVSYPILRHEKLSSHSFQLHLDSSAEAQPLIVTGALEHWPALNERPWCSPAYLLSKTLGGRRLVPIEIGAKYTDTDWGQRIVPFGEFLGDFLIGKTENEHICENNKSTSMMDTVPDRYNSEKADPLHSEQRHGSATSEHHKIVYLAQHDLFSHIPSLRADIAIPDYCYTSPPQPPPGASAHCQASSVDQPLLNAWFGPAGTVSPLHTDPYHNILAQVVGYKYVRLYGPHEDLKMYPRGVDERGVDMGNTSRVDLDAVIGLFETSEDHLQEKGGAEKMAQRREFMAQFPLFRGAGYVEAVLGPGECLYIPVGWWHYVRSLTVSFSVSFWWS